MEAMFGFITTEMKLDPKSENSFWPASFVFVELRHFFSQKISQFWNFQNLQDEIGKYFLD